MKRFRFRFETVLSVRKRLENESLRAVALAQRAKAVELARKERLLSETQSAFSRMESLGDASADIRGAEAFRMEQDFISGNKARIIQVDQAIVRANRVLEKAMRAYLQARRATRTIEILREKDFEAFRHSLRVKEQKDADEMTIMRHRMREVAK